MLLDVEYNCISISNFLNLYPLQFVHVLKFRIKRPQKTRPGKFPVQVSHNESLVQKCEEQKATIKFQLKKVLFNYFIFPVLKQFLSSDLPARKFCLIYIFLTCLAQVMWAFCMPHVHIENQLWKKYRKYGDVQMKTWGSIGSQPLAERLT
jgi:hypothetical protein